MRLIKPFLVGIIGLFVVITLLSLYLPSKVKVSRAVVINSTTGKVYAQIADFKKLEKLAANICKRFCNSNFFRYC